MDFIKRALDNKSLTKEDRSYLYDFILLENSQIADKLEYTSKRLGDTVVDVIEKYPIKGYEVLWDIIYNKKVDLKLIKKSNCLRTANLDVLIPEDYCYGSSPHIMGYIRGDKAPRLIPIDVIKLDREVPLYSPHLTLCSRVSLQASYIESLDSIAKQKLQTYFLRYIESYYDYAFIGREFFNPGFTNFITTNKLVKETAFLGHIKTWKGLSEVSTELYNVLFQKYKRENLFGMYSSDTSDINEETKKLKEILKDEF